MSMKVKVGSMARNVGRMFVKVNGILRPIGEAYVKKNGNRILAYSSSPWKRVMDTFYPIQSTSMTFVNGKAYAFGGTRIVGGVEQPWEDLHVYDEASGIWSIHTLNGYELLDNPRIHAGNDGTIYIYGINRQNSLLRVGQILESGGSFTVSWTDVSLINPRVNAWIRMNGNNVIGVLDNGTSDIFRVGITAGVDFAGPNVSFTVVDPGNSAFDVKDPATFQDSDGFVMVGGERTTQNDQWQIWHKYQFGSGAVSNGPIPAGVSEQGFCQASLTNAYIFGGVELVNGDYIPQSHFWKFNPLTRETFVLNDFPGPPLKKSGMFMSGNYVYVVGGNDGTNTQSAVYRRKLA